MAARVTRLLVRLSGADPRILRMVPEETARFAALGGVILTTAVLAGLSMLVALTTLDLTLVAAVPGAVLWSALVANLDRLLVVSLQRQDGGLRKIALVLPRLALAIVLGMVTSTPLVLLIFEPAISAELAVRDGRTDTGLLAQLEALSAIAARDATVNVAQYVLLLLFVLCSVLPVLVRILGLFGPLTRYERCAAREAARADLAERAEALRNVARTRAEVASLERDVAERLADLLTRLGPPGEGPVTTARDERDGGRS